MANIVIRLTYNLETGKKDILIDYTSEDDALPIEHERDHREFIEDLLGKGVLEPDEVGNVRVQRVTEQIDTPETQAEPAKDQRQTEGQGN